MIVSKARNNFVANLVARVWSAMSVYFFLPAYLGVLGREAFGLVAFFATMNVAITVLVSGWTRALRFEFSKPGDDLVDRRRKYELLRSYEVACLAVAAGVAVVGMALAPIITRHVLTFEGLQAADVTSAIRLMFCCVAAQLLASAFASCLHGLLRQVRATVSEVVWATTRAVTAWAFGMLTGGDVVAFFAGFFVVDIGYAFALRLQAFAALERDARTPWSIGGLRDLRILAAMSLGVSVTSIVYFFNTQIDRVAIGKVLGLADLGAYNLAAALAQVPIVLTTAVAVTAFPVFVRVFHRDGRQGLGELVLRVGRPLSWVVATLAAHLSVFAPEILTVWLGDASLGAELRWVAFGLIGGSAMLALQQLTYEALLAQSVTRVNLVMSLSMLPYSVVATPLLVGNFGLVGGAFSWLALMTASTCCYQAYVHAKYFEVGAARSVLTGVIAPFFIAFGWALAAASLASRLTPDDLGRLAVAGVSGILSVVIVLPVLSKDIRLSKLRKTSAGNRLPLDGVHSHEEPNTLP
ncbi:hypothetical protein ASC64_02520 [Nocardioides sp. Root122]|uniref:lipopolysaccharide biosynthesis protein n=1 Tax=Nocardioides TaxID=1839 RepID=UPI000702C1EB|nr:MULTISPECIES: lipopolysaccharide biosynthesis protein [Nocardioides]KQV77719.1 hypothetical protein ASC64_02520 [Nocardioides sp. Root122]MCK9822184.1 lipopolysaccharide biosynthesis protein [Nocardioides cavernae]